MNITEINNFKSKCTGCSACFNVCPSKSISLVRNEEGFFFPEVNEKLCSDCGECVSACQISDVFACEKQEMDLIYAFQAKDVDLLINATSGGLFPVIAKKVLSDGGVVFGAAYNENMSVEHIGITRIEDINKLNGSKYVQSDTCNAFNQAKIFLEMDKKVLFSGTPCQINGLKAFLGKEYSNLITVDVICYGVPSETFFKKYIEIVEEKESAKVIDFKFRDKKKYGWSHTVVITFEKPNGKVYSKIYGNEYNNLWYRAWKHCDCLRESCYSCDLVSDKRVADLTIGNFWGIDEVSQSFDSARGVSLLTINNPALKYLIEFLEQQGVLEEQTCEMIDKYQHGLKQNKERTDKRDSFYIYLNEGYMNMINNLYPIQIKDKIMLNVPIRLQKTVISAAKKLGRL